MTARELIEDVSRRLAERTEDDEAQGWAADLNQAIRAAESGGLTAEVDGA